MPSALQTQNNMQEILNKILEAKEQRQALKKEYAKKGYATVSINFNIPGYPKTDEHISTAFEAVCFELTNYLKAIRLPIIEEATQKACDEAGDIFLIPFKQDDINLSNLKQQLETFEQTHPLGRLLDVDLFDRNDKPISSHKQKGCFICKDKYALYCMRHQTHTYEELRNQIHTKINDFNTSYHKTRICKKLTEYATWAILTEVSILDKPGLVSPNSNGSHTDMNYHTFIASVSAISTYFTDIAKMGYDWDGNNKEQIINQLRVIGLQMEHEMFKATKNINTQKGIIFLITFCLFTSAYSYKKSNILDIALFRNTLKKLNKNLVNKELTDKQNNPKSHGEKCFKEFGKLLAGGIRQEVEEGLPTFFDEVYPFMQKLNFTPNNYQHKQAFDEQCMRILIKIMSVNNDTNILFRSNAKVLEQLKTKCKNILDNNTDYSELKDFCKQENISPGGSADMLAVSLFLFRVMQSADI